MRLRKVIDIAGNVIVSALALFSGYALTWAAIEVIRIWAEVE